MTPNMRTEPVAITSAILGFVTAALAALVGFGVIDSDQSALVLGLVAAAIPLAAVLIQRPRVTPTDRGE